MAKIITRRFWVCDKRAKKSLVIDVRTRKGVHEIQAQFNAEHFAETKFGTDRFSIRRVRVTKVKPNFSIGPRE